MRYWIDTEFLESGPTQPLHLFSIGIVAADGREYYAVNKDCPIELANDWVKENVLSQVDMTSPQVIPFDQIRDEVLAFVNAGGEETPEFWGYYCVAPETKILTADLRWVAAETLKVGDALMAFDEYPMRGNGRSSKWRQWKTGTVEAAERIERPCYELTFDDGTVIRCSAEHRWLVANQEGARWVTTEDMACGASVVKPVDVWEFDSSREAGYLAAAFDGEGCFTQSNKTQGVANMRLAFSQKQNAMLSSVHSILASKGYTLSGKINGSDVHTLTIGNRSDVLRFLGSVRPERLLPKFDPDKAGAMFSQTSVKVIEKKSIGWQPVISIATDAKTYIAEGLASHNCDYDWVVFCQLFGSMVDLPKGWPMFCYDLKQWAMMLGNPRLPEQTTTEHHALADARWTRDAWVFLHRSATRYVAIFAQAIGTPLTIQPVTVPVAPVAPVAPMQTNGAPPVGDTP